MHFPLPTNETLSKNFLLLPCTAVLLRPLEALEVAIPSRVKTRSVVPRAVVRVQPLEALQAA